MRTLDLSGLDLLVIQIDGIYLDEDLILVAALGVDAKGDKHPLGLAEGATENAATVQALIDNLVERGLDPAVPRLFIIDGAKALSQGDPPNLRTRRGDPALSDSQGSQHYGAVAQIAARFSPACIATSLWELNDADKAEKLLRNLAQRLERQTGPGLRLDPGRHRRDPHRHTAWIAERTATLACLYQHDRECDGYGAA